MKLTTGYHLLLRLTMNGAVPALPVYAFHGKHRDGFYMSINCLFNEEITECAAFVVSLLTSVNFVLTYLSA